MADESSWLTIGQAAKKLGVTHQAIRGRIGRGTLQSRRNNRGMIVVLVDESALSTSKPTVEHVERPAAEHVEATRPGEPVSDRFLAYLEQQVEDLKTELAETREAADLRLERALAARDRLWQERVDAAEVRAERAQEQALSALNDAADAAERITKSLIEAASKPLWRRLFG